MSPLAPRLWKLLRDLPTARRVFEEDRVVRVAVLQLEYDNSFNNQKVFMDFFGSLFLKLSSFSPHVVVFPALTDLFFIGGIWSIPLLGRFLRKELNAPEKMSEQCERFMVEFSKKMNCTVAFGTRRGLKLCTTGYLVKEKRTSVKGYGFALAPKRLLVNSEALSSMVESGVRIVATPTCGTGNYSEWNDKYYFWSHAQMVGYYCLKATLVGEVFRNHLKDKACVCAPIPITQSQDGYIVRSDSTEGSTILLAELDMEKLEKFLEEQKRALNTFIH